MGDCAHPPETRTRGSAPAASPGQEPRNTKPFYSLGVPWCLGVVAWRGLLRGPGGDGKPLSFEGSLT